MEVFTFFFVDYVADDCSLALGHICASLSDNIKILFAQHYLVVVNTVDTFIFLFGNKVDGETLGT